MVHAGNATWPDQCPSCGLSRKSESLSEGAASIELGFSAPRNQRPSGVSSASSFSWARDPENAKQICEANLGKTMIVDEYGRRLTCGDFLSMLKNNCPMEFTHSIGLDFLMLFFSMRRLRNSFVLMNWV